jgi:excinuclease ABC subunit A
VLYVLDEPSIGLHQRDNARLLVSLKGLRDLGNSVLVVEHDEEAIMTADYVIDMGPLAGVHGGEVIAHGTAEDIMAEPRSITGQYLSGARAIEVPDQRRPISKKKVLRVIGATGNNLKNVTAEIPVGVHLHHRRQRRRQVDLHHRDALQGPRAGCNASDAPPARADRGIGELRQGHRHRPVADRPHAALEPATYRAPSSQIRDWLPACPRPRARGYGPGRFGFNVKGGRCEACRGDEADQDRDALPTGRLRHLRRLPRQEALQPRNAGILFRASDIRRS